MDDVYNNIDNYYNPKRKQKTLIVFDGMIADFKTNKKIKSMVVELFFRCRKLHISLLFITQSYFLVPKEVRLHFTHYLIMKNHNKRELQSIAYNPSAYINYNDSKKIYRKCLLILHYQLIIQYP